jgi:endonuclease/exonuclease/phosphatase family metal-dependent hydrolase
MLRRISTILVISLFFGVGVVHAQPDSSNKDRILKVMTRNMDAGSDFYYVLNAAQNPNSTQLDLLTAITQTYLEMHMSNIPQRADGIASEIEAAQPDLVGLQEVTVLSTGAYLEPPTDVVDSALDALLTSLQQRGLHYVPVAVQQNAQVVLPAFNATFSGLIDVGLIDYDVVLARSDLPVSEFKLQNIRQDHFSPSATLNFTVGTTTIPFLRGWISLDAKLRGKTYRFVTTHLETFSADYQAAQTEELLAGPLNTDLSVILAGDLNSDAHTPNWASGPAYGILTAGGFDDFWNEVYPGVPGFTWPLFLEDSGLNFGPPQRIDLILTKGDGIQAKSIMQTGTVPINGLWSSDHAGVAGSFVLLP